HGFPQNAVENRPQVWTAARYKLTNPAFPRSGPAPAVDSLWMTTARRKPPIWPTRRWPTPAASRVAGHAAAGIPTATARSPGGRGGRTWPAGTGAATRDP